ncbi:oligopeptide/dipeptide ABC transporter ATP-binding protein, partial [Paenibacillus sp. TAF58]
LKSMPRLGGNRHTRLESIEGTVPMATNMPPMCGFYERCKDRIDGICNKMAVPKTRISDSHMVRCFLYKDEGEGE